MVARYRSRQLTLRLTETEVALFEAARQALHRRGATRSLPTQGDTLVIMAAAVCRASSQDGAAPSWCLRCGEALAAWEGQHGIPGQLQRRVGRAAWAEFSGSG